MKLEVGKKYKRRDGHIVTVVEKVGNRSYPFLTCRSSLHTECGCWLTGETNHADLVEEVNDTPTHLPPRFKLNPGGNEALSKAMQERLFELGIKRMHGKKSSNFEWPWIHFNTHGDGEYYVNTEDTHAIPLLKLDDLYTLQPTPKELPKLEIAGRTLELKNGRVVGSDFDCALDYFKSQLETLLIEKRCDTLGAHEVSYQIDEVKIGCQTVAREDLQRALSWAEEVTNKGAA